MNKITSIIFMIICCICGAVELVQGFNGCSTGRWFVACTLTGLLAIIFDANAK